ncbi:molybdopterin-dependent oxidoreductase [Pseudoroseicyclus sp. H15]
MTRLLTRRRLLTVAAPALLLGCDRLNAAPSFREFLGLGEKLSYGARRLFNGDSLVREYSEAEMSPDFRTNGTTMPQGAEYRRWMETGFADWRLKVGGLVDEPYEFSLDELRALPARTQITRHDCVEGWSAIGQWTGPQLSEVLSRVGLQDEARYIVFRCADSFGLAPYYESIDLNDAFHPQTILAYGMNGADLPVGHGAPVRLRVERQLGYKNAKYLVGIDAVASLAEVGGGNGGYWEDAANYEWFAGI